jgi:hypothetical protein
MMTILPVFVLVSAGKTDSVAGKGTNTVQNSQRGLQGAVVWGDHGMREMLRVGCGDLGLDRTVQ